MRARGPMRSASLRRSRHGKRRASTRDTSIALKARFASGWSGVRGSRKPKLPALRERHAEFRAHVDALLAEHELLLMPAIPVARLVAGADHSQTRGRLLRYTVPFSLAGVPVVTIPCAVGGMQLAAARGSDEALLELSRATRCATSSAGSRREVVARLRRCSKSVTQRAGSESGWRYC